MMRIYERLLNHFGEQEWWPCKTGRRFEIIAGAILTQNTNWKNVEKALDNLAEKKKLSRNAIKSMSTKELSDLIKPSGYYKQKAKKLKAFVNFSGKMTRKNLLSIWGIGPETADSILLYAYNKPYFVIDAYTKRVFTRLGLLELKGKNKGKTRLGKSSKNKAKPDAIVINNSNNYEEIRKFFESKLPKDVKIYKEFHALIVELAKNYCRKEPLCSSCPLKRVCRFKF